MRLTAIRLAGFKSFADPTLFQVDAPVTGIIGPNGCGKSNIIDAVRWVLGESAAKQLRGQALSDVIFAGAKGRRAAGLATVTLYFDNHDHSAQGPFSKYAELVVQRQVASDGQSQYRINQQRCRRKDVVELLQGTGVGARSYAVIEQGMVSRIVESKPEDLRQFVEEAAGIAVYKTRKKDSEQRMAQVEEHLTRHDDRLRQLVRQRQRLEKEAESARAYRKKQQEKTRLEHQLTSWQYHALMAQKQTLEQRFVQQENALAEAMLAQEQENRAITSVQTQLQTAETAFSALDQQYHADQQHCQALKSQQERLENDLTHLTQRVQEGQVRLTRYQGQLREDHVLDEQWQLSLEEIALHIETAEERQSQWQDNWQQASTDYEALEQRYQQAQQARQELDQQRERLEQQQRDQHAQAERLAHYEHSLQSQTPFPSPPKTEIDWQGQTLQLQDRLTEMDQYRETLIQQQETQKQTRDDAENGLRDWHNEHTRLLSRRDTLREWMPESSTKTRAETDRPRLYQTLTVQEDWREAIETHFAGAMTAIVCPSGETTPVSGQNWLRAGNAPEAWRGILESPAELALLLAHLRPLAKMDEEIDFAELPQGFFLTLSGSVCSRDGFLAAQSGHKQGLLAQQATLQALEERLSAHEKQREHQENRLAEETRTYEKTAQALHTLETDIRETQQALTEAHHQQHLAEAQRKHAADLAERQRQELARLEQDKTHLTDAQEQTQTAWRQWQERMQTLPDIVTLAQERDRLRDQASRAKEVLSEAQIARQTAEQQQQTLLGQKHSHQRQQQRLSEEIAALNGQMAEWQATMQMHTEEHSRLATHLVQVQETGKISKVRWQESKAALDTLRKALGEQQTRRGHAEHTCELIAERRDHVHQQLEAVLEQCAKCEQTFVASEQPPLPFSGEESVDETVLANRIHRLTQEMERLGAVNLAAEAGFAEAESEYQTLSAQCEDLRETLVMLKQAIAQLDGQTRERLKNTFAQVNQNFQHFFPLLFRGGEGKMQWTNEDVLDAGITLAVRPPGKKVKNISVLSGGEKALTAVALVFSFFKLNPAPFCLLDEIDAPLDDGNVGRLNALLREMAVQTQFIMITHHKRSMQSCDHLIGVTMSEPGVSRLVSVKFDSAES